MFLEITLFPKCLSVVRFITPPYSIDHPQPQGMLQGFSLKVVI